MARRKTANLPDSNQPSGVDLSKYTKWLLTIDNPIDHGFQHKIIKEKLEKLNYSYYCISDEYAKTGTLHTHVGIVLNYGCMKSRIKKLFPPAHYTVWNKEPLKLRQYVFKINWSDDKDDTRIDGTQEEDGQVPTELQQGKRTDLSKVYELINQGCSVEEIIDMYPCYLFNIDRIERAIQKNLEQKYSQTFRKLKVTYIYGKSGIGKTRHVKEKFGYKNVYSIFNYRYPFDNYKSQKCILFDEFRSQLTISDMLQYLDGYPLMLPCRYYDKTACYTNVYIISNIPLEKQYKNIQLENTETWNAFLRRINEIYQMDEDPFDNYSPILVPV